MTPAKRQGYPSDTEKNSAVFAKRNLANTEPVLFISTEKWKKFT